MSGLDTWKIRNLLAFLSLSACSGASGPGEPAAPKGNESAWTTTTDPLTGRTFHCFTQWEVQRSGLAMWCYEIAP